MIKSGELVIRSCLCSCGNVRPHGQRTCDPCLLHERGPALLARSRRIREDGERQREYGALLREEGARRRASSTRKAVAPVRTFPSPIPQESSGIVPIVVGALVGLAVLVALSFFMSGPAVLVAAG